MFLSCDLGCFTDWLKNIADFLWMGPILILLVLIGIFQTIDLKFLQFRQLGNALKLVLRPSKIQILKKGGDIHPFQALMTALAGAIGTGNITGIATAVWTGGTGALFWMWLIAVLGMATAYSETILAMKYRIKNAEGNMSGGPMYTLLHGFRSRTWANAFAILASIAILGTGCMVQAHSVADAITEIWVIDRWWIGIAIAVCSGAVIVGGVQSIGRVAGVLVPFMAILYLSAGVLVLFWHFDRIPSTLYHIVYNAFNGQAAMGGFLGATISQAVRMGVARGLFSNEAGLGSLPIAAASSQVKYPAHQGLLSIAGVFISTLLVCTITGLVLSVTGVLSTGKQGSALVMQAFSTVSPHFQYIVLGGLILFAFTTILAWAYYGEKCIEFLLGLKAAHCYKWIYVGAGILGAGVTQIEFIWYFADIANALMAVPNLLSILWLSKVIKKETQNHKLIFDSVY